MRNESSDVEGAALKSNCFGNDIRNVNAGRRQGAHDVSSYPSVSACELQDVGCASKAPSKVMKNPNQADECIVATIEIGADGLLFRHMMRRQKGKDLISAVYICTKAGAAKLSRSDFGQIVS